MPAAGQTISTTRITLPPDTTTRLERVDAGRIAPEHAHLSLVFMTTLMQAVTGSLLVMLLFHATLPLLVVALLGITAVALNISVFHLGRPAYAWRALKMWRRSWLSREVLLFGLFFVALTGFTAATCLHAMPLIWLSRAHLAGIAWLLYQPYTAPAILALGIIAASLGYRRHHRQLLDLPGTGATVLEHGAHPDRLSAQRRAYRHYAAGGAEHNPCVPSSCPAASRGLSVLAGRRGIFVVDREPCCAPYPAQPV